jgi:hypothetical protein
MSRSRNEDSGEKCIVSHLSDTVTLIRNVLASGL